MQSTRDANALEQLVGGRLLTWAGAFVLIVSVSFFIPWAWEYFKLPDWVKVLGFHLLSIGILVTGHVAGRYRLPILAHALAGLGVFMLYATAFVTLHVYDVYENLFGEHYRLVAFAECAIITIALRTGSAAVIIIGALGRFLTPLVISSGTRDYVGLFSYLAFLNVALIASAILRKWSFLKPLSLIATAIMFGLWLMDGVHYNDSKAWPTEGFLILHATIFLLGVTIPPLVWKRRSNGWDLAALAANSMWFIGMTRVIFHHWENQQLALVS